LTKPLGVGIYSAAFKKDALTAADYAAMVSTMTTLNNIGAELAKNPAVHAMTDVTGFGILGHGLEMARGSRLKLALRNDSLPLLPRAAELARAGFVTGASGRNWDSYGQETMLPAAFELWRRQLLTDPQTSGGLLIACAPDEAASILSEIQDAGYRSARIIGEMTAGCGATVA
jgi:selenide,water dikinase